MHSLQEGVGLILLTVIFPVRALIRIVCWDAQLKRGHTGKIFIIKFAYEMNHSIIAAKGWIQIDQELGIKPSHFTLKYVRDGLPLVIL